MHGQLRIACESLVVVDPVRDFNAEIHNDAVHVSQESFKVVERLRKENVLIEQVVQFSEKILIMLLKRHVS